MDYEKSAATSLCSQTFQFGESWSIQYVPLHIRISDKEREYVEQKTQEIVCRAVALYRADYAPNLNLSLSRWNIPSPLIRLDMAPGTRGIYEVESNPAGMGVLETFGLSLAPAIALSLKELGITRIAFGVAPSRATQREDLRIFMKSLEYSGIETEEIGDVSSIPNNLKYPLWLRAGEEDMDIVRPYIGRCLLLHQHGGGHKGYLVEKKCGKGAKYLSAYIKNSEVLFDSLFEEFKEGFVLKPKGGWGTRSTNFWTPNSLYRKDCKTRSKMENLLRDAFLSDEEYIIQHFAPPDVFAGRYWIWRLYAVYVPSEKRYRLLGGFLAGRTSLRIHGSGDTLNGLVYV
ncbi:hypothetical protein L0Y49_02725 [bacterium]|nr:hypothetical protein [bacterium]